MFKRDLFSPTVRYFALVALYQPANNVLAQQSTDKTDQSLGNFAIQYSNELLVAACLFLLVLSSIIGVFYKTPVYGGKPLPLSLKAPVCVAGGFCAFLYCLHADQKLTLLTPIWVGAMSFIAPAILHLVHAVLIKHFGVKMGIDPDLIDQLEADRTK